MKKRCRDIDLVIGRRYRFESMMFDFTSTTLYTFKGITRNALCFTTNNGSKIKFFYNNSQDCGRRWIEQSFKFGH